MQEINSVDPSSLFLAILVRDFSHFNQASNLPWYALSDLKNDTEHSLSTFFFSDFLVDQEAFFQSLKQFEKDRQEASSGAGIGKLT